MDKVWSRKYSLKNWNAQTHKKVMYSEDFQWAISSIDLGILVTKIAGFMVFNISFI